MTLQEYRLACGWSLSEMARRANIDYNTLKKAVDGENVSMRSARAIAQAISKELGQTVRIQDIEGLNISK